MNKFKVYHLFLILYLVFLIVFFLLRVTGPKNIDFSIGDTYYVISYFHLVTFTFFAFLIQGAGYYIVISILKKSLVKTLTVIHSIIFIGGIICCWLVTFLNFNFLLNENYVAYPGSRGRVDELILKANLQLGSIVFTIIIGLPIYCINLLIGVLKKTHKLHQTI